VRRRAVGPGIHHSRLLRRVPHQQTQLTSGGLPETPRGQKHNM
jgi:hypothetical protein